MPEAKAKQKMITLLKLPLLLIVNAVDFKRPIQR